MTANTIGVGWSPPVKDALGPDRVPWALLAVVSLFPGVLAVALLGRIHADEIFQFLEPALRFARGYGVAAWEWTDGVRNWAIPMLLGVLIRACDLAGIEHPIAIRAVLEVPQYLLHLLMMRAAFLYVERRVGRRWAMWSVVWLGLYGMVVRFAGRTLGESFSAAFLLIAVEALDRPNAAVREGAIVGANLGFAMVARYGSGVFVLVTLIWLAWMRRWRVLAATCGAGLVVAIALGALDWITWGAPFHSLVAYARFNVLTDSAARRFGAMPAYHFVPRLLTLLPVWAWIGLAVSIPREHPRCSLPLASTVAYILAISLAPHKETRFLYPALVILTTVALPGVAVVLGRLRSQTLASGLAVLVALMGVPTYVITRFTNPVGEFYATVAAGRDPRTSGLLILDEDVFGTAGSFYIGRNIPWTACYSLTEPACARALVDPRINRAIARSSKSLKDLRASGFRPVRRFGRAVLLAR